MKRNWIVLLIVFSAAGIAAIAQKTAKRVYIKASNPYFQQRGVTAPYSDGVLVGDTLYV